jgi:hypothetical protein
LKYTGDKVSQRLAVVEELEAKRDLFLRESDLFASKAK